MDILYGLRRLDTLCRSHPEPLRISAWPKLYCPVLYGYNETFSPATRGQNVSPNAPAGLREFLIKQRLLFATSDGQPVPNSQDDSLIRDFVEDW